ncbi:hypothetical protein SAMN05518668_101389 [Sphingobium sp. YR657]|nr:hypothetical protein SAMN05518668_101389 [Sphingobium sp. YR657]
MLFSRRQTVGAHAELWEVAVAEIVGNQDGAHFLSAQHFHALNDVG